MRYHWGMTAYKYALKRRLKKESAEDFSQWVEVRKLELNKPLNIRYLFLQWAEKNIKKYEKEILVAETYGESSPISLDDFDHYISCLNLFDQLIVKLIIKHGWTILEIAKHTKYHKQYIWRRYKNALGCIRFKHF